MHGYRDLVVKPNKSCSPCLMYPFAATRPKVKCCEPMCVNEVSVEQVLQAAEKAANHVISSIAPG